MKGNVWLAGYIVLSLLAVGAAGYYTLKERGSYNEKFGSWNSRASKIGRLEKEVPTPTKENEERFEKELEAYEAKVDALFESLAQFQKPLNKQLKQEDFPNILKQKVDDFRKLARDRGTNITALDKPEPFFMAMDRYGETLPKQEITPLLSYQLDAIEQVLGHVVNSGMGVIDEVSRQDLPGEVTPVDDRAPRSVVQKYPITVGFEGSHAAFRDFQNQLANDKEYFFILRVIKVENSAPDGPSFSGNPAVIGYLRPDGTEVPKDEVATVLGDLDALEREDKLNELGWVPKRQDAAILFGEETVEIIAVIDLVRFLSPDEMDDEGVEPSPSGSEPALKS